MKAVPLIFAVASMPFAAHAEPDEQVVQRLAAQSGLPAQEIRASYDGCDSSVTRVIEICRSYRLAQQEIRMDRAYQRALAEAPRLCADQALVGAQNAWTAFRAKQCPFEGQWNAAGGSAEGLFVLSCQLELTRQQADRLEALTSR